ncbi:MAG TPA: hypothetical protein PLI51_08810 [bacterium]|nr:hypothetical protein [bacterium]
MKTGFDNPSTRIDLALLGLLLLSQGAAGLTKIHFLDDAVRQAAFLAAGVCLLPPLFLLPGNGLLRVFSGRRRGALAWLGAAAGFSWIWLAAAGTGLKLIGLPPGKLGWIALVMAPTLLPGRTRTGSGRFLGKSLGPLAAGAGVLLASAVLTWKPFLIGENALWPNEFRTALNDAAKTRSGSDCPPPLIVPGEGWRDAGKPFLAPAGHLASLRVENRGDRTCRSVIFFFFSAQEEMLLEISVNGRESYFRYFPPPYSQGTEPRNFPPGKAAVLARPRFLPGENQILFSFRDGRGRLFPRPPRVEVLNASDLPGTELARVFASRWLFADTGDIREQLDLARSLRTSPLPRTSSYNGSLFDGGGVTVEHLPFPFLQKAVVLDLWVDGIRSFQLLSWGFSTLILAGWLALAAAGGGRGRDYLVAAAGGLFLYLSLHFIRYRIDTPYVGLGLGAALIWVAAGLAKRDYPAAFAWAAAAVLTKGGIAFLALVFLAWAVVYRRRETGRVGAWLLVTALVLTGAVMVPSALLIPSRELNSLLGGSYWDRFGTWSAVLGGDGTIAAIQKEAALFYLLTLSAASGYAWIFWFCSRGRRARAAALFALAGAGLIVVSRPSLVSPGFAGFRLSYLAPALYFIPIPVLIILRRAKAKTAGLLAALVGVLILVSPRLGGRGLDRYRLAMAGGINRDLHQAAVIDYLLRRDRPYDREILGRILPGFYSGPGPFDAATRRGLCRRLEERGRRREADEIRRSLAATKTP